MCRIFIVFVFTFYFLKVFAQNETVEKYYQFLLNEEIAVGNELIKLSSELNNNTPEIIHQQYLVFKNQINTSLEKIEKVEAFEKGKYLKDASLKYLEVFKHLAKTDFKLLIDIYSKEHIIADDKNLSNQHLKKIQLAVDESTVKLDSARKKFIESFHLTVDKNPYKFYLQ